MKNILLASLLFIVAAIPALAPAATQSTAFTYQGRLLANGQPANGNYDLSFKLFDTETVGTGAQIGSTISMLQFPIVNGAFTTDLDFPGSFTGSQRWLEVKVGNETLNLRQPVNSVPVAQYAMKAPPAPVFLSSATNMTITTTIDGLPDLIAVLPLSGQVDFAYSTTGGGPFLDTSQPNAPAPQILPTDGSIGSIRAVLYGKTFVLTFGLLVSAQVYMGSAANAMVPVGASCLMFVDNLFPGNEAGCELSGLAIPYSAGTKAVIVVSATALGPGEITTINAAMSVSVGP